MAKSKKDLTKDQAGLVPSTKENNGRLPNGKFAKGNKCGPGNPYANKLAQLRASFYSVTTPEAIREVAKKLIDTALHGEGVAAIAATKLLFQYVLSTPDGQKIAEAISDLNKLKDKRDDELEPYLTIEASE